MESKTKRRSTRTRKKNRNDPEVKSRCQGVKRKLPEDPEDDNSVKKLKITPENKPEAIHKKANEKSEKNKASTKVVARKQTRATLMQKKPKEVKKESKESKSTQLADAHKLTAGEVSHPEEEKDHKGDILQKADVQKGRGTMTSSGKLVGAHTSISGGLYNAVLEAVDIGAKSFGMFLKSQRQWVSKPLQDQDAEKFQQTLKAHGFSPHMVVPHGSYLMNCGSPNPETLQKSRDALVDELQRCEQLGLTIFNFHPGSTCGEISVEKCLDSIAESINLAHNKTKYVIAVVENMSCQGNTVGGKFSELRGIIERVKDKARIGVCFDTCHAFAAGYDLTTDDGYQKTMNEFDSVVGFKYLKAVHLNDSKGDVGCHLDRHENIGKGKLGLDTFRRVMQDPRFDNIPMVLETPGGQYPREIKLLYKMCK